MKIFVSSLLFFTLGFTLGFTPGSKMAFSAADPEMTSINSEPHLKTGIELYIAKFQKFKSGSQIKNQLEFQISSEALSESIVSRTNGGTALQNLALRIRALGRSVRQTDNETYNDLMAWMGSKYLEDPDCREPLTALIQQISNDLESQNGQSKDTNAVLDNAATGTTLVMFAAMIMDCRKAGCLKKLYKDLKAVFERYFKSPASKESSNATSAIAELETSLTIRPKTFINEPEPTLKKHRVCRELMDKFPGVKSAVEAAQLGKLSKIKMAGLSLLNSQCIFFGQLATGAATGGLAGAAYGLDQQSQPEKVDPKAFLTEIQAFAVVQIMLASADLRGKVQGLSEIDPAKLSLDRRALFEKRFSEGTNRLVQLKRELEFLNQTAPQYAHEKILAPDLLSRLDEFKKRSAFDRSLKGRTQKERISELLEKSEELSHALEETYARYEEDLRIHGLKNPLQGKITLELAGLDLETAGELLEPIENALHTTN